MGKTAARARLSALAGIVLISLSAIFVRLADRAPITAAFFRAAYAAPALALLCWALTRRGAQPRPRPARLSWLALGAGAFLAIDLYFWHQSIGKIGAGLATVVANTQVPFVGLAAWLIHRERPHARSFIAVPLVFLGVILISGLNTFPAYGSDPMGGALLGLMAGMVYSVFLLMLREAGRGGVHPLRPLLEVHVAAAVVTFLIGTADGRLDLLLSWPAHGWLAALSLGCSVLGWALIAHGMTRLPALETSVMLMLQPMLTMLWAAPIFGEWISAIQWAGVVLVMGGVGYLSLRGAVRQGAASRELQAGAVPGPSRGPGAGPAIDGDPA